MRVLGIDEAGRGCVFGDLVVGAFLAVDVDDEALRLAGAGDSKAMSASKRQAAREALASHGLADIRRITPYQIDRGNLNALEEQAIVELIHAHQPQLVLIDALGHPSSLPRVLQRLRAAIGPGPILEMHPKADANFPAVGAASIFAKTTRDESLHALRETYGDLGSGYPSDPRTRAWLANWARTGKAWPPFVRTRWQTVTDLAQVQLPV